MHEDATQRLQRLTVETAVADHINPIVPVYVVTQESGWDTTVPGDYYHGKPLAYGCAQFHKPTFDWMKAKAGMPDLSYKSCQDQIILMEWGIKNSDGYLWTTFRNMK